MVQQLSGSEFSHCWLLVRATPWDWIPHVSSPIWTKGTSRSLFLLSLLLSSFHRLFIHCNESHAFLNTGAWITDVGTRTDTGTPGTPAGILATPCALGIWSEETVEGSSEGLKELFWRICWRIYFSRRPSLRDRNVMENVGNTSITASDESTRQTSKY